MKFLLLERLTMTNGPLAPLYGDDPEEFRRRGLLDRVTLVFFFVVRPTVVAAQKKNFKLLKFPSFFYLPSDDVQIATPKCHRLDVF